jgi:hypothetical protein
MGALNGRKVDPPCDREMPLDEVHPNIAPGGFDAGGTLFVKKT